jgi:hypothetical protein
MDRCADCAPGLGGWELRNIFHHLKRPEVCAPETLQELIRTPKMQEKLVAFGIIKKPDNERERPREEVAKRQQEVARLSRCDDRKALYDQIWSQLISPSPPDGPTNCIPRSREEGGTP